MAAEQTGGNFYFRTRHGRVHLRFGTHGIDTPYGVDYKRQWTIPGAFVVTPVRAVMHPIADAPSGHSNKKEYWTTLMLHGHHRSVFQRLALKRRRAAALQKKHLKENPGRATCARADTPFAPFDNSFFFTPTGLPNDTSLSAAEERLPRYGLNNHSSKGST